MLLERIKEDRIVAFKARNNSKRELLSTLLGEASKDEKEPSDEKLIATIKKFIKNNEDILNIDPQSAGVSMDRIETAWAKAQSENDILKEYIPKQMSEAEIKCSIDIAKSVGNNDMKTIMAFFKTNLNGKYDGGLVSKLIKESL